MATYWPPVHREERAPLLGTAAQFCSSFFHVMPCSELGIASHVCLRENPHDCHHKCVTGVVRMQGPEERTVRYTNCIPRVGRPIHAEEFIVADPALLVPGARLTLYLQLQPCHHSGGCDQDPVDTRSCAELVVRWHQQELIPRGIALTIRCANIYKAVWEFTPAELRALPPRKRFGRSAASAREGLRLLTRAGLRVSAIDPEGWRFLAGLAQVRVPDGLWPIRQDADRRIEEFLRSLDPGTEKGAGALGTEKGAAAPGAEKGAAAPGAEKEAGAPGAEKGAAAPGSEKGAGALDLGTP